MIVGCFVVSLAPIADGDIFWHLASGRQMVRTGRWLTTDPFTTSALGRPWIDVHWLFQLAAYGVNAVGGLAGLVVVKAGLVALGAGLSWRAVVRAEAHPAVGAAAAIWMLGALFLARHLLLVRPVIVTLVFLSLFFVVLERHRLRPQTRLLFVLPALQVVWVNCQGLSALGPALVACYACGALVSSFRRDEASHWRGLALVFGLCCAASLVTPYGTDGALLPAKLLLRITPGRANVFADQVAENVPPFILERTSPAEVWHVKWFLAALGASLIVAGRRVPVARLLVIVMLVTLALFANRNVLLLYWLGAPIAALNLAPLLRQLHQRRRLMFAGATVVVLVAEIGVSSASALREPPLTSPTPFRFPTESVRSIAARAGSGSVFAPDHQGGYITWALGPNVKPYIDTRLVLHTESEFAEYLGLLGDPESFAAFAARQGFDWVVLPTAYPDRYLQLLAAVARSPDWTMVFTDGTETLFARAGRGTGVNLGARETTDSLLSSLATRYGRRPDLEAAARVHLAKLEIVTGHREEARFVLGGMSGRDARQLSARCQFLAGDLAAAERLARALSAEDSSDVHSLVLLAQIALRGNRDEEARASLRRALKIDPYDAEALALLGTAKAP